MVELLEYERKEIKFDSVEALKRQLSMDKEKTQEILEKYRGKKA